MATRDFYIKRMRELLNGAEVDNNSLAETISILKDIEEIVKVAIEDGQSWLEPD